MWQISPDWQKINSNSLQSSTRFFQHKSQSHGQKVIDLGVTWEGYISGECMPNIKFLSLLVKRSGKGQSWQQTDKQKWKDSFTKQIQSAQTHSSQLHDNYIQPVFHGMHVAPAKAKRDRQTTSEVIPMWRFASLVPQKLYWRCSWPLRWQQRKTDPGTCWEFSGVWSSLLAWRQGLYSYSAANYTTVTGWKHFYFCSLQPSLYFYKVRKCNICNYMLWIQILLLSLHNMNSLNS